MRKLKEECEQSKEEILAQKKVAKSIREKMADYQKLTFQLATSEKKYLATQEENNQLRCAFSILFMAKECLDMKRMLGHEKKIIMS